MPSSLSAIRDFARRLMREVWEPFDDTALPRFYHPDVVGHHRGQVIGLEDIASRLQWDRQNFGEPVYEIFDIIAEADRFAIRFAFTCRLIKQDAPLRTEVTYFYHLKEDKISAFWLLSDADFDYKQLPE